VNRTAQEPLGTTSELVHVVATSRRLRHTSRGLDL
jgi:hypothetical protein